jgi:hypothetical protein
MNRSHTQMQIEDDRKGYTNNSYRTVNQIHNNIIKGGVDYTFVLSQIDNLKLQISEEFLERKKFDEKYKQLKDDITNLRSEYQNDLYNNLHKYNNRNGKLEEMNQLYKRLNCTEKERFLSCNNLICCGKANEKMNEEANEKMNEKMNEEANEKMNEKMNEEVNEKMNEEVNEEDNIMNIIIFNIEHTNSKKLSLTQFYDVIKKDFNYTKSKQSFRQLIQQNERLSIQPCRGNKAESIIFK